MTYLHDACEGEVEVFPLDGCCDNYGLCTECGLEGELTIKDTDEVQGLTFVTIEPVCIRT